MTKTAAKGKPARPKTAAERKARVARILKILDETYPNATCALTHRNAWELLVATILSAQCTDKRVNEVTPGLFRKYPTIADFAHASPAELANDIRSTGFFRNKTKSLIGAARTVLTEFGGEVPRTIEELTRVPGAARKTANVVLGTAFGIASGVVVDTHVQRISQRLDLTKNSDPVKIREGPDEDHSAGPLDPLLAPDHPPRPSVPALRTSRSAGCVRSIRSVTRRTRRFRMTSDD